VTGDQSKFLIIRGVIFGAELIRGGLSRVFIRELKKTKERVGGENGEKNEKENRRMSTIHAI